MQTDTYTPGYSTPMVNFLAQRTAETHAAFFLPHLKPGLRVLDAGCGPGSITLGLGARWLRVRSSASTSRIRNSQPHAKKRAAKHSTWNSARPASTSFHSRTNPLTPSFPTRCSSTSAIPLPDCRIPQGNQAERRDRLARRRPGRPPDRRRFRRPCEGILGIHGGAAGRLEGFERRPETRPAVAKGWLHRRAHDSLLRGPQRSFCEAWPFTGPAVCHSRQLL